MKRYAFLLLAVFCLAGCVQPSGSKATIVSCARCGTKVEKEKAVDAGLVYREDGNTFYYCNAYHKKMHINSLP